MRSHQPMLSHSQISALHASAGMIPDMVRAASAYNPQRFQRGMRAILSSVNCGLQFDAPVRSCRFGRASFFAAIRAFSQRRICTTGAAQRLGRTVRTFVIPPPKPTVFLSVFTFRNLRFSCSKERRCPKAHRRYTHRACKAL